MGPHPTSHMGLRLLFTWGLSFMLLLFWFFMVDCFVSLSDSCSLRSARILFGPTQSVGVMTVNDCCEGRVGVKCKMVLKRRLISVVLWLESDQNVSKRVQYASISYETLGTGGDFSGEDFQNIETFIGVRSSVFAKSSTHKMHPARDA